MTDITSKDKQYIANTYSRLPVEIACGKGSLVYDTEGRRYIDLGSGIAVNTFGVCDEEWIKAVNAQINAVQHTSNIFYSAPCVELAEVLCTRTGMKKVFFANSGAEANECAIKIARKYGEEKQGKDCYTIITLKNSFHGRTLATLAATGQDAFHEHFFPFPSGFVYADANDIESVNKLCSENKVCAVMFEPVQGEGGVTPLDGEFVKHLYEFCKKKDILLIADEVQTGNGRCGKLYGYMNYGITPDVVTTAKGLGGGLPIGACIMGEKCKGILSYGDHGSTFGGNPAAAAGALSIINRIDDKLLNGVKERSEYIFRELSSAVGIISISGMGLMIGITTKKPVKEVQSECIKRGVLCLTAKDKLRLLPALNIPFELLKEAVSVIKSVCAEK